MVRASKPQAFRIASATLFLLLAFFVVLSLDVIVRVWSMRAQLPSAVDAAVLLSYESARALTTVVALALAWVSYRRSGSAAQRAFTLLLLFLALWYTKAFSFARFPGHLQEEIAEWLFARGAPRSIVFFVFGAPVWAAWLALGALLRISVCFPGLLDSSTILQSGRRDRAGLLRGTSLAGADVAALFRRMSAALLRHGGFRPVPVWLATAAAGVLHAVSEAAPVRIGLTVSFALLATLAITNLRAATIDAPSSEKRRVLWMLQATIVAVAAFAASALLSMPGGAVSDGVAFALAGLAPPAVLMGMAYGVTHRRPPDPAPAIGKTLLLGIAAVTIAATFVLSAGLARSLTAPPVANAAATLVAALATLLLWSRIRRVVARLTSGVAAQA